MIDLSIPSIRVAKPADFGAVGALLAASYSSLLADHYGSDTLGRALPILTKANPTLLASGTYYVAEGEPDNLVGCGGWATRGPRSELIIDDGGSAHLSLCNSPRVGAARNCDVSAYSLLQRRPPARHT